MNKAKLHVRFCEHCEERLGSLTMKCPRCDRLVILPVHIVLLVVGAVVGVKAVFIVFDLLPL